ncbi:peptidoglycan/LPS O-acetylase OafA/YrhL [Pontibacter ummariensis]|uniref:Peptidoglycan/LPS O-acetylase OafA/YrhL, contains acyltransferase and SGNH-hydrolase domains n=1 Tax=Pontibacter ummariensis TaxID=1610492 RepID=A0A239HIA7_9BACT|nr:acyltransferase [Pontibacter ummariensis]PRY10273.1 peptidoglycan/LPS O-acetylase OafA/YrhL [Pontibacter ummariensis]SNS81129.1 Peptidoglycan/LPS O-acetylase OafA/YrhL, contains acyltransferase and SGNH-hydrolase domains [Pontibacter ummariensis]
MERDTDYIEKIDVVRAVACLMVFLYHACQVAFPSFLTVYDGLFLDYQSMPKLSLLLAFSPVGFGWSGVPLFLLISGFLIHYGYLQKGTPLDIAAFINRRFWRIYPVYLLVMLFFAITVSNPVNRWDIVSHLLLIHNWDQTTIFSINPSLWSLALEFQLYMLFPLFLYIRNRVGINKTLLLLSILAVVFSFGDMEDWTTRLSLMRMWVIWGMGAWLAERYVSGCGIPRLNRWQLAGVLMLVVSIKFFNFYKVWDYHAFSCFYLLALGAYLSKPVKKLNRVTRPVYKVAVWFGLISYSVYLIHQPFLPQLIRYFVDQWQDRFSLPPTVTFYFSKGMAIGFILLIVSAVAYTLYTFLELESVKWGRAFFKKFILPYRKKAASARDLIKV